MQPVSEDFWRRSTDTYFGSGRYYERKAAALDRLLGALTAPQSAVDIGCGDGRYTLQIARHAAHVEGRDISPALVDAATRRASEAGVTNAQFVVAAAGEPLPKTTFDLVTALGVTSCIVEDQAFRGFLADAAGACRPGGSLVLVDSLSRRRDALSRFESGYVARYRLVDDYRAAVSAAGFDLLEERDLGSPATNPLVRALGPLSRRTNRMFWFRRAQS